MHCTDDILPPGPPYLIGITGPIGSGKSTLCRHLEGIGYPIYYSDTQAIGLIEKSPTLHQKVKALLGDGAFSPLGQYQRGWVAARVFANPNLLNGLNGLVHPAVASDIMEWSKALYSTQPQRKIHIVESALLTTPYWQARVHTVVSVLASEGLRKMRVTQRDATSPNAVAQRIARQPDEGVYRAIASLVLTNNHSTPAEFLQEATAEFKSFIAQRFNIEVN